MKAPLEVPVSASTFEKQPRRSQDGSYPRSARPKITFSVSGGLVNKGYETMLRHSCLEGVREAGVVLMIPECTAHNVITCMDVHVQVWPSCERHSRPPWTSRKRIAESTNGEYCKEHILYKDNGEGEVYTVSRGSEPNRGSAKKKKV